MYLYWSVFKLAICNLAYFFKSFLKSAFQNSINFMYVYYVFKLFSFGV